MGATEIVAGRFEVLARVATGGMGTIHRALDRQTGRQVACPAPWQDGEAGIFDIYGADAKQKNTFAYRIERSGDGW